jgi:SOUL heme-binding protein
MSRGAVARRTFARCGSARHRAMGPIVSNVEQPKYQIAESSGSIEIRDYPPMIVAEAAYRGTGAMPLAR